MCSDVFVFVKDEMTGDILCNQRALQHLLQKTKTLPDHPFKLVSLWLLGNIRCTRAKFSSLHKSPAVTTCMWQSLMATGSCCLCQNTRLQPFLIFRKRRVSECGREKNNQKTTRGTDQIKCSSSAVSGYYSQYWFSSLLGPKTKIHRGPVQPQVIPILF